MEMIQALAVQKAAVVFIRGSCCMCHSIMQLFHQLGANPEVHDLDLVAGGREMELALRRFGRSPPVPAVFIGGNYVGSAGDVIALHIDGSLRKMLIRSNVIWL